MLARVSFFFKVHVSGLCGILVDVQVLLVVEVLQDPFCSREPLSQQCFRSSHSVDPTGLIASAAVISVDSPWLLGGGAAASPSLGWAPSMPLGPGCGVPPPGLFGWFGGCRWECGYWR